MNDEITTDDFAMDDSALTDDSSIGDDGATTDDEGASEGAARASLGEASAKANSQDQGKDRDFVEFVVQQLVDDPSQVVIKRKVDELGVFITVSVAKDDMGKLIGKNGQTVDALRVLLRVIGAKENNRVNLKVVEPGEL